jgi:multiple sugar transport system substrate-binding protein
MVPEDAAPFMGATTRRDLLRKAGVVGATFAGGSLLAACGSGGSGTTAGSEQVTIDFWDEIWGGEAYQPTVKKMIAAFERSHPNVTVNYRAVPWANFYEIYNTAIASGSTPDVAVAPSWPWTGSVASLDGVARDWRGNGTYQDVIPAAIEEQKDSDGLLTGLPWGVDVRVISYRKDLFSAAGVEIPTTLDEIDGAARALARAGHGGLGFTGDTAGYQMLVSFFYNNGGGLFDAQCGAAIANDRNAEVCEWIQRLVRAGAIPKAAAGWTVDDLNAAMSSGTIAMAHNAPGWFTNLDPKIAPAVNIMAPPTGFHGDKGTLIYYLPLSLFKNSEHQEQASEFISWWLDHLPELFRNGQVAQLPARRSLYDEVDNLRDPRYKIVVDEWVPVGRTLGGDCNAELLYKLAAVEGQSFLTTLVQDVLTLKPVDKSLETANSALAQTLQT